LVLPALASQAFAQACPDGAVLTTTTGNCAKLTSGTTAVGTVINAGGKQTVSANAATVSVMVNSGGSQSVGGIATSSVINNGGMQAVSSGGSAVSTVINSGGSQAVSSGGSDIGTAVAGKQSIISGGASAAAMIVSGGSQTVSAGGAAAGTVIGNSGTQRVNAGGVVTGTVVNSGGVQSDTGGMVSNTIVNSGGSASVTSGGTAINTTVNPFARQTVTGGLAVGTVLIGAVSSGGSQFVSAGGSALDTSVGQKARQTISSGGIAIGTTIMSGGSQTISSGAQGSGTMVLTGGQQFVIGGGTATGTTVAAGASATLYVGGTTSTGPLPGPVFTSGTVQGTLILTTSSTLGVTGSANAAANALVLQGGSVVFAPPDVAGYKTLSINGLSGTGSFTLNTQVATGQGDALIVNNGTGSYKLTLQDTSTTTPHGVKLLLVGGTNDNASFTLANGSLDVGAEKYGLENIGGQYYLFDTGKLGDAASVVQTLPGVATMIWYGQSQQVLGRLAELRGGSDRGLWVRAYGQRLMLDSSGVSSTSDVAGVQFGRDWRFTRANGDLYAGITGGVAQARTDVGSSGSATVYPFNAGFYGGFSAKNGWFTDASVGYIGASNSLSITGGNSGQYDTNGFSATLQGGRRLSFANDWTAEPHVGLTYLRANGAGYALSTGVPVQLATQGAAIGNVGATLSRPVEIRQIKLQPYLKFDAMHAFAGQHTVDIAGTNVNAQVPGTWAVLATGLRGALNQSSYLYADVSYGKGQHYQSPITFMVGLTYQK
jgi:outer membrane autotransporter protein